MIGSGKMGELTAKYLCTNKVGNITVINRTYERAKNLADQLEGNALAIDKLSFVLMEADLVISSIQTENYVITNKDLQSVIRERNHRPLYLVDIAVPRSIDPSINELENIILYNIDDLRGIVKLNLKERDKEANKIGQMIEKEIKVFKTWLNTLGVVPLITALRSKSLIIQEDTVRSIENKLPSLTERELKIIRKYTKSIVNQMLHDPLIIMKEMIAHSNKKDGEDILKLIVKIFAIEEEVKQIKAKNQTEEAGLSNNPQITMITS